MWWVYHSLNHSTISIKININFQVTGNLEMQSDHHPMIYSRLSDQISFINPFSKLETSHHHWNTMKHCKLWTDLEHVYQRSYVPIIRRSLPCNYHLLALDSSDQCFIQPSTWIYSRHYRTIELSLISNVNQRAYVKKRAI